MGFSRKLNYLISLATFYHTQLKNQCPGRGFSSYMKVDGRACSDDAQRCSERDAQKISRTKKTDDGMYACAAVHRRYRVKSTMPQVLLGVPGKLQSEQKSWKSSSATFGTNSFDSQYHVTLQANWLLKFLVGHDLRNHDPKITPQQEEQKNRFLGCLARAQLCF